MGNKNRCWACSQKHYPPTGNNCVFAKQQEAGQVAVKVPSENDTRDSSLCKVSVQKKTVVPEKDSVVKKVYTSRQYGHSDSEEESSMDEGGQLDMQQKILVELLKVSSRLEVVESQMAVGQGSSKNTQKYGQKLSTVKQCSESNCRKSCCAKTSSEGVLL